MSHFFSKKNVWKVWHFGKIYPKGTIFGSILLNKTKWKKVWYSGCDKKCDTLGVTQLLLLYKLYNMARVGTVWKYNLDPFFQWNYFTNNFLATTTKNLVRKLIEQNLLENLLAKLFTQAYWTKFLCKKKFKLYLKK